MFYGCLLLNILWVYSNTQVSPPSVCRVTRHIWRMGLVMLFTFTVEVRMCVKAQSVTSPANFIILKRFIHLFSSSVHLFSSVISEQENSKSLQDVLFWGNPKCKVPRRINEHILHLGTMTVALNLLIKLATVSFSAVLKATKVQPTPASPSLN